MTDDLFTSRPLADVQSIPGEVVPEKPKTSRAKDRTKSGPTASERVVRPQPIVDLNLDDVPETDYSDFRFLLKGNVYTLGIDDDSVLFEISEMTMDEVTPTELFEYFFERTFRDAVDEEGNEIPDGLEVLLAAVAQRPKDRSKPVPRKSLLRIMNSAVDEWMGELTDVSMRPKRRSGRRR